MASFETVAAEYDAARPGYPSGIYDALGPLDGLLVLDVGAGTGIATRDLIERGASVIAVDSGPGVLGRATARTPGLKAVAADGAILAIRDDVADLVCFAQAWHWLDRSSGAAEAHRVLRDRGRWAGWWSHARADDEDWFDAYWSAIERSCIGTHRGQRDTDWGATLAESGLFSLDDRVVVPWIREASVDEWMTDQVSHSYVVALGNKNRERLLQELRGILDASFSGGIMAVRYETWMWTGTKV